MDICDCCFTRIMLLSADVAAIFNVFKEFDMYLWHQRLVNGKPSYGWCRSMYQSLGQQLMRQDPTYYLLYVQAPTRSIEVRHHSENIQFARQNYVKYTIQVKRASPHEWQAHDRGRLGDGPCSTLGSGL
ncbi:hypothetical protein MGYG_05360 [Nannizzia gypsea CBS 118893]|uniref:Uncharacterized protein n=1 Tax=Arthroderma gypseum (strain ATCC MYA-4604 / CBS 118893) TaxID=535722 RepID=E4UVN6_ARTGP|nr:hypothetical protein MGYG_05360 [Nannizzia gypsea CBS 118893]EFR02363.1 hypothetical protein MGYG_05360 [Nannizzia gypsea CBS 118893]